MQHMREREFPGSRNDEMKYNVSEFVNVNKSE